MIQLYAAYLLAYFRERRAYIPLIRILAARENDLPDRLFGETIPGRLKNILASVYDGNPEPLKQLVEGEYADEFVRAAAQETFRVLAHTGQIPRETAVEYYGELIRGRLTREPSAVWDSLVYLVGELPAPELLDDLRKACADNTVGIIPAELAIAEEEARIPLGEKQEWIAEDATFVTDPVSEMEWWAAFEPEPFDDAPVPNDPLVDQIDPAALFPKLYGEPDSWEDDSIVPEPIVRAGPKIGRNDPCPCGSGKKFKKCCLGK